MSSHTMVTCPATLSHGRHALPPTIPVRVRFHTEHHSLSQALLLTKNRISFSHTQQNLSTSFFALVVGQQTTPCAALHHYDVIKTHSPVTERVTVAESPPTSQIMSPLSFLAAAEILSPNKEGVPLMAAGDEPV